MKLKNDNVISNLPSALSSEYFLSLPDLKNRQLPLSLRAIFDYTMGHKLPSRTLNDVAMSELIPKLSGEIIEIGASKKGNHRRFATNGSNYVLSNILPSEGFLVLDAMNMALPDNSVDNFVSVAMLEHMPDPRRCIYEMHRTLKVGGKAILVVPFMFPFHAAPSDFFRFTDKGLAVLLDGFKIIHAESHGNVFSTCAKTPARLCVFCL